MSVLVWYVFMIVVSVVVSVIVVLIGFGVVSVFV